MATAVAPELEFTGERIVPGKTSEALFREHEERYVFAGQHVAGKDVLDIACGTGIGTDYLRKTGAARCWGIDIDPVAVAYAQAAYGDCAFTQGDATQIGLPNSSIDVVVSFETIEHIRDQEKFVVECGRVLRPGGKFICSTPNTTIYRWQGKNPYHVHELTTPEFVNLLGKHFEELAMFSQRARNYPGYLMRRFAAHAVSRLGFASTVRRLRGQKQPESVFRKAFGGETSIVNERITPYHANFLVQPMYLVAIARKAGPQPAGLKRG
jgi:ubiquinone/menaquinone biosynthesis C-methylase UbiE